MDGKITEEKVKDIKNNLDMSNRKLTELHNLSYYVVRIIKEVRRKGLEGRQSGYTTKFDYLTKKMKNFLKSNKDKSWTKLCDEFNEKFRGNEKVVPITDKTLAEYTRKICDG